MSKDRSSCCVLRIALLGVCAFFQLTGFGCTTGRQFREAALPAIESGATQILAGFLNGLFAAIEVEPAEAP